MIPEKWRPVFGPGSCALKMREAERREAHCPANVRDLARRVAPTAGVTPPFGAHACGTRHRLSPRWLSSRTGFPATLAGRCFACFAHTMPRLSTLRADRSSCRSTGDPKAARVRIGTSARGDRVSLSSYGMPSGRRPRNERDGGVIVIAAAKSKALHLRRWIGAFRPARFSENRVGCA